jgi:hypothetical protein
MRINISTGDQFNKLLSGLENELIYAELYFNLFNGLAKTTKEYSKEANQSKTFWTMLFTSFKDSVYIRLCRIYDQNTKSLNLVNLIDTINKNRHLFSKDCFKERNKEHADSDWLSKSTKIPTIDEIEKDIKLTNNKNPIVKKLMIWRNNIVAHKNPKISLGNTDILNVNELSEKEVKTLLDTAWDIFNKYSCYFNASTMSRMFFGGDDFKKIFKHIRKSMEYDREKRKQELIKYGINLDEIDKE